MLDIALLTTGGSLDKIYGRGKGVRDLTIGPPVAGTILKKMGLWHLIYSERSLMKKDSLDMTDRNRKTVAVACAEAPTKIIIVTHGTDTMVKTAEAIQSYGIGNDRLVILTGAAQPYCLKESDAVANLCVALGFALAERHRGIFIAMNGIHRWDNCHKDPETGIFMPGRE
jgi:L-asparaginase